MHTRRWIAFAVSTLSLVTVVGIASAAATPQQKCETTKLKALGKVRACLLKQRGNVILGKTDESAECLSKFQGAIDKADAKAAAALTSCRYIVDGDGTLSDLNTGLRWEQKDDAGGVHDKDNAYSWGATNAPDGTIFTSFLYGLNGATSNDGVSAGTACFAGYCDWRIPTVQEFAAILTDEIGCGPCVNAAFGTPQNDHDWAATTVTDDPSRAWIGAMNGGVVTHVPKTAGPVYGLAVRGGL